MTGTWGGRTDELTFQCDQCSHGTKQVLAGEKWSNPLALSEGRTAYEGAELLFVSPLSWDVLCVPQLNPYLLHQTKLFEDRTTVETFFLPWLLVWDPSCRRGAH